MDCCFCKRKMSSDEWNTPTPLASENEYCCTECNKVVLQTRLNLIKEERALDPKYKERKHIIMEVLAAYERAKRRGHEDDPITTLLHDKYLCNII